VFSGGVVSGSTINSGGTETIGIFGVVSGTVVSGGGSEVVRFGGTVNNTVLRNGATQFAFSGGAVSGTVVSSGAMEVLSGGATADSTVVMIGGAIDLPNLRFSSGGSAALDTGTGILTVTEGGKQYQQILAGAYANVSFQVTPDTGTGTLVTMDSSAPCFVTGTHIATDNGEVVVELLTTGDRVRLFDGRNVPIVWIGHRRIDCRRHPKPDQVWPVRVAMDAFGPGKPHRDLLLSPDHALFVDDVLIPVKFLINGTSVTQVEQTEVMYHHVELAIHDVLIAEGLAAESYLDTGDRLNFGNGGGAVVLHPNFAKHVWEGRGCAKLVVVGRELESARRTLDERAPLVCSKRRRMVSL